MSTQTKLAKKDVGPPVKLESAKPAPQKPSSEHRRMPQKQSESTSKEDRLTKSLGALTANEKVRLSK